MESVWVTQVPTSLTPQGTTVAQAPYQLLSTPGALGVFQLLKASYHMGAPGSAPFNAFNEGATPVEQTSEPLVPGPQA